MGLCQGSCGGCCRKAPETVVEYQALDKMAPSQVSSRLSTSRVSAMFNEIHEEMNTKQTLNEICNKLQVLNSKVDKIDKNMDESEKVQIVKQLQGLVFQTQILQKSHSKQSKSMVFHSQNVILPEKLKKRRKDAPEASLINKLDLLKSTVVDKMKHKNNKLSAFR